MVVSWLSVSENIQHLLEQAVSQWETTSPSQPLIEQAFIEQALIESEHDLEVLVAAYRYYFYRNNNPMALVVASKTVELIQTQECLPQDWMQLKPILLDRIEDPVIRLYLNAYSASGLLLAKLGEIERAKAIATQIQAIDLRNEFGATLILDILTPSVEDDDEAN
ncbi:hypothetical protein H6G89_02505 [Oscillatoria sp. FACHB-1407]|uniref:hypothetical protein n=1 Tax=Oscillatoria sp. FACHB-1407 TaxID=2692847 RepID=UPI001682EA86|nr:hypothetical protein [Oscillatoria sp. FACHB-1407]MBD2459906.1 hypothetical protein [Oscillatoria sp. FACHB-1407]